MGLPTALQNAEEEANELIRKQSEACKPAPEGNTGDKAPEQSAQPQQERTPEQKAPGSEQTWEHKYRVLQGKYNADTKQLRDDLERAKQNSTPDPQQQQFIQQLQSEITSLKQQLEQQQTAGNQFNDGDIELDKDLVDEYGEEFARAVARQAGAANQQVKSLEQKLATLQGKFENNERVTQQTTASMRERELTSTLSAAGIDFAQTNEDPLFHDWLKEVDQASGETRNELMNRAYQKGDVQRTAYFFKAFKAQEGSQFNDNPLQQHVDVTSRAPGDTGAEDNVWTKEQISKLYDDYNKGVITKAEFDEWERKLFAAYSAGTVIG